MNITLKNLSTTCHTSSKQARKCKESNNGTREHRISKQIRTNNTWQENVMEKRRLSEMFNLNDVRYKYL